MLQASGKIDATAQKNDSNTSKQRRVAYTRWQIASEWAVLLLLCAIALAFDLYRLGNPSIWFDEAFSVELARQPLPLLWHIIFGPEPNMELYYLFLHFWLAFTGWLGFNPTEVVVRLPSAIFAALSTGVVYLLGRRFLSMSAGIVGAGLYLLNYLQLTYAQQTRSYSLQLLLLCIAWFALLSAWTASTPQRRWWLCYVVASVLAVYAQLFSAFVLFSQGVAFVLLLLIPNIWQERLRKHLLAFGISLVAIGLLSIPMVLESRVGAKTGWLPIPHWHDLINLFATMSGYNKQYLFLLTLVCIAGVLLALAGFVRPKPTSLHTQIAASLSIIAQALPFMVVALCWFAVPTLTSYVVSHTSLRLFSSRYLVVVVPALCLLASFPFMLRLSHSRFLQLMQVLAAFVVLLVALNAVPLYYASAQVEDWNSTVHWLIQQYQTGDGLVCYDNAVEQGCQISVEYYLHAYPSAAHFEQNSPGAFSWANFGPQNPATGYEAAVNPTDLAAYGAQHARLFFVVGRVPDDAAAARALAAQHWLDSHYHFIGQIVTRTVTIRLYATTG